MFTNLGLSNTVLVISAVIAGVILGGLCAEALRRSGSFFPRLPQWNVLAYGGGMLLGGGLLGGCMLILGGGVPSTAPVDPCAGLLGTPPQGGFGITTCPTPTNTKSAQQVLGTDVPRVSTLTPSVPPPLTRTADVPPTTTVITPTATLTVTPRPLPSPFDLTLFATDEKLCQKKNFQAPYRVTIQGTTMTLLQVDANIASVGTYTPATGAFTTTKTGLPGTEIYTGTLTFDGTTIKILGTYTYTNDPNVKCVGLWVISGQKVVQ